MAEDSVEIVELVDVIIGKIKERSCADTEWFELIEMSAAYLVVWDNGTRIMDAIITMMNSVAWFMEGTNPVTDKMRADIHAINVSIVRNLRHYGNVKWGREP